MRIDQLLVQRGLASTRSQAQRLIADGVEWLNLDTWKRVAKNGDEVSELADIRLLDDSEARYVSRGGLKLEAALKKVGLSVEGLKCLDVGQSTGGLPIACSSRVPCPWWVWTWEALSCTRVYAAIHVFCVWKASTPER
jgi:predicted rRNA methylase YqxC with S4 and FtsJ domains